MLDVNELDIIKARQVKFIPVHFKTFSLEETNEFFFNSEGDQIKQWITTKLRGRFCLIRTPDFDSKGKFRSLLKVGFEDQKELTYFILACPHIRRT